MEYEGLNTDDLVNVQALNRAWLKLPQGDRQGTGCHSERQLDRLAAAPFLLFSFREQDQQWWQSLLGDCGQRDLLDTRPPASGKLLSLQSAGLAFLWDLARRNPYVARIVSGASLHWCEQIASATPVRLLECATCCHMIEPRFDDSSFAHRRLLQSGGSALRETRIFAHIGALQEMLTGVVVGPYEQLSAAACKMRPPAQQVADEV